MDMTSAIKVCFRKYFDFKGRAARPEFWWFQLFIILVGIGLGFLLIQEITRDNVILDALTNLFFIIVFIPSFAVAARRLHDVNLSGYWQLPYILLTFAGYLPTHKLPSIVFLTYNVLMLCYIIAGICFLCKKGDENANQYGPPPTFEKDYA